MRGRRALPEQPLAVRANSRSEIAWMKSVIRLICAGFEVPAFAISKDQTVRQNTPLLKSVAIAYDREDWWFADKPTDFPRRFYWINRGRATSV
jgi:hypothetical protein